MESWHIAIVTLVALLVGMLIPVLLQLRAAIAELRREVRRVSKDFGPAVADARVAAERIRCVTDGLQGHEGDLGQLIHSGSELVRSLERLRATTHVATAVAVAVGAGVRAFHDARADSPDAVVEPPPPEAASTTNGQRFAGSEPVGHNKEINP